MRPVVLTKSLTAGAATNICLSQTATGAQLLLINGAAATGGVATLDTQRRVLITSGASDAGITFTITGTRQNGQIIQEVVTGGATTATSNLDFFTVTSILTSGATASTVTVGTNTVGSTDFAAPDWHITPVNIDIGVVVVGTINFTVEYTYDDYITVPSPYYQTVIPTVFSLTALAAKAANTDGSFTQPIRGWRLTVNSGTGSATATGIQAGIIN